MEKLWLLSPARGHACGLSESMRIFKISGHTSLNLSYLKIDGIQGECAKLNK